MKQSEIFISYRREGGEFVAKKLRDLLVKNHYHAFLDIEGLGSGDFNEHLLQAIDESLDYILVLSQNSLERCKNNDDWVRREIEYASEHHKHIITLVCKDFSFPDYLPESCQFLKSDEIEKIEYNNLDDIDTLIPKLKKILNAPCHKFELFTSRILPLLSAIIAVTLITFLIALSVQKTKNKFPNNENDELIIREVFSYIDKNLRQMDKLSIKYNDVLDSCIEVSENYPSEKIDDTVEKIENLWGYVNNLKENINEYDFNSDFIEQLGNSHFSREDVLFLSTSLQSYVELICKNIENLAEWFYLETENDNQTIPASKGYFHNLKEEITSYNDNTLLIINGITNPISSNYNKFINFKNTVLTNYASFNFEDYVWLSNNEIESQYKISIDNLEKEEKEQQVSLNKALDDFEDAISGEIIQNLIDAGLTKDEAYIRLEEYNEIQKKKLEITKKQLSIAIQKYKFKQLLSYVEGDDEELLYKKMNQAFMNCYYDVVLSNIEIFLEKYPNYIDNIQKFYESFLLFKENQKHLNFKGILIVTNYNGNSEYQKEFNIGDIILSVDNIPFSNFEEFIKLRSGKEHTIQYLQNDGISLRARNITCEGTLGIQLISLEG